MATSISDSVFNNLRQKLDVLGYTQTLPLAGIPLVGALFEDLVKTTESLRDAKKKIVDLLEEKSCWELGVEPYKCNNSRLLAECNELHLERLKEREEFEHRACDYNQKIRNLQSDKQHLEEHCQQLQHQLKVLLAKQAISNKPSSASMRNNREGTTNKPTKKPFITTVRSGVKIPGPLLESNTNIRCTKCNSGYYQRTSATGTDSAVNVRSAAVQMDFDKLESKLKDISEQVDFYKRKIEARDREILRLNDLLQGGRPTAALAKDCCYKDVGTMSDDIKQLQQEKLESLTKIRDYQEQMHEAMQRAMELETHNKEVQKQLEELKDAALQVEEQANVEISQREREIESLQVELQKLRSKLDKPAAVAAKTDTIAVEKGAGDAGTAADKRRLNERLNELTQKESELRLENERSQKKIHKLKSKINAMQKESQDNQQRSAALLDEEKIRLKSERDFFQKEYLRLVSKSGSEKEIEFLQTQVKSKDEELRILRSELCLRQQQQANSKICVSNAATGCPSQPTSARTCNSDSVQAVVLRAERERDCARSELERVRCERDTLRERHVCMMQMRAEEMQKSQQHIDELSAHIKQLECEKRDLNSARLPTETQIVLLKQEVDELKQNVFTLQRENCQLRTSHNQLKILHEQTERSLAEYQNKLALAERQLQAADMRLNTLDSNRETTHSETMQLRSEVAALKQTYVALENEKDKILMQLDVKTERAYQLEFELKACKEKRNNLEKQAIDLEQQLQKLSNKTREHATELHETSTESKSLRQQITALKASREEAIAENARLTNDLTESQAEILTLKKKLKDSELEIERMKQQLRLYVQEVKKAEDLLAHKEKEREEMLEHYRSLSHDAVMLEGNNQSLEVEAAEYKRQLCELESEIDQLKKEICCRNEIIEQAEDKISALKTQNSILERQLEEANDDLRLLKVDLAARKELCDKLDVQKDKLNAELTELCDIRRRLERDNEKLRSQFEKSTSSNKVPTETLEELLGKTRRDLEEQIQVDSKLSMELVRLRQQNDDLLKELDKERQKRQQHEILAHEYHVQNQELRHNLTDDRFRQARSREQSPRYPSQTL